MRRCSRNWLFGATSLLLLLWAAPAQAQELPDLELPCAPDVIELRRAAISHEGQPGLWWHREVARCMAGRLMALPQYVERIRLLETQLTIAGEREGLVHRQALLAEQEAAAAVGALEAAVRGRREAEEDLNAWYRSPILWVVVGAAVVIILEVVAVWAFGKLDNPI